MNVPREQEISVQLDTPKPSPPLTFSQELHRLAHAFGDHPTQLGKIIEATQERGLDLLLVLIALPFLTPLPMLGLSIPFGILVVLIGAPLAFGFQPWLPKFLLNRNIPPNYIRMILHAASRLLSWLEIVLRPRLTFLLEHIIFRRLAGVLILLSGLLLLLPVPVPFSNSFPAATILLLAAGAMERDGCFFLCGCAMFALTIAFFTLIALGGMQLVNNFWRTAFG